jgi:alpha-mannosidase
VVEVNVGLAESGARGVTVLDSEDQEVPVQRVESASESDGSLRLARLAFVARDVPALGYSVYRVVATENFGAQQAKPSDEAVMENPYYRLAVDRATGAMTSLRVQDGDWEVLSGPGNVVAREEDKGDLWELYRGLDGGSKIAMTNRQAVPREPAAKLSHAYRGDLGKLRVGPVFSEFSVAHPFDSGTFTSTVRLYQELRRIEFKTTLVNHERLVRYQAVFPVSIKEGRSVHEIPFGAVERPEGVEFPAQNWVDYGNGRRGVALLNVGLPGNLVSENTMMVSLLRAHTLGAYGFGGGYEPGMTSDSGYQLGRPRTLSYALVPHAGDWREAAIFRDALEFNHPLQARKTTPHKGRLPNRWGMIDVSNAAVVLSALKPGRDGRAVLRLYEATGRPALKARIAIRPRVHSAREADLMEVPGSEITVENSEFRLDFRPFEIKTIVLPLGWPAL